MTKLNITLIILFTISFLVVIILLLYKYYNERIKNVEYRINTAQETTHDKLKNKLEIVLSLIEITEKKYKIESKTFEQVKKIKPDSHSLKNDQILSKCYNEIIEVKEDNPKIKETKALKETITNYEENELHIISLRTYFNNYALEYNSLLQKFPYNIIAKIKKYKMKLIFEGKEINNNNEID